MCDHNTRANTIILKYKYPFISRKRSTLVATLTYVHTLSRIPLPNDEEYYGVRQYQNCAKPSYFPSNSVCQHNQNSKMCQHDPEHIRIFLLLPDYDAPLTHIQSTVRYSFPAMRSTADGNLPPIVMCRTRQK